MSPTPQHYDLIVIGGGINGTGILRDAAERGLKTLLVEKNDFGAGTTAYSSRLIHGGLRYLENFEFDLVHESLQERERLLKNAPHLVKPIGMAIPIYGHNRHNRWLVKAGMIFYDVLSFKKSMPAHRMYGKKAFLQHYPGVNTRDLKGGAVYYDAQVELPERICVENVIAARETGHANAFNHTDVTGFVMDNRTVHGIRFTDRTETAQTATGMVIVNAAGPWVDELIRLSIDPANVGTCALARRRIGGTKGSHIVVKKFQGGPDTALYVEARTDGRPFFIIPWRRDYYLIGTTDIHFSGNPDHVSADEAEIEYLLRETNQVLPQANLKKVDVLYAYAGVRPLPYVDQQTAGKITRRHLIDDHAKDPDFPLYGLLSIIGGKLTTYRNLAEEAVDYAIRHYGLSAGKSTTRDKPLPGGDASALTSRAISEAAARYGISEDIVDHLTRIYGSRFGQALTLCRENPDWKAPLREGSSHIGAQVIYAVRSEMACTLADVLLRRMGAGLDADCGLEMVEPISHLMARELGWSAPRMQSEITTYRQFIEQTSLAFKYASPNPAQPETRAIH